MKKQLINITLVMTLLFSQVMYINAADKKEITKEETIYVSMDENGQREKSSGSIHIYSDQKLGKIQDKSKLEDIQVISEVKDFTQKGEAITWEHDDKHLYYQGDYKGELPVSYQIKYYLDGKAVQAQEILGQEGQLKMEIDSFNHHREKISVDGQEKSFYVPYLVAGLIPLDKNHFSSVTLDQGKLVSDGNRDYVLYLAMPGMKENFDLDFSEKMTIEAKTKDFKMDSMYFFAIPFDEDLDLDLDLDVDLEEFDGIKEKVEEGFNQLEDGSKALYEGQKALNDGVDAVKDGSKKAKDGSGQLADGSQKMEAGIHAAHKGSSELKSGSKKLAKANEKLYGSFQKESQNLSQSKENLKKELHNRLDEPLEDAQGKLGDLSAGTEALSLGSEQLYTGIQSLHHELSQMEETLLATEALMKQSVSAEDLAEIKATVQKLKASSAAFDQAFPAKKEQLEKLLPSKEEKALLEGLAGNKELDEETIKGLSLILYRWEMIDETKEKLKSELHKFQESKKAIDAKINQMEEQLERLENSELYGFLSSDSNIVEEQYTALLTALAQLESGSKELALGNKELSENVQAAQKKLSGYTSAEIDLQVERVFGALNLSEKEQGLENVFRQLRDGSVSLDEGAAALNQGLAQLDANAPALSQGANDLHKGLSELEKGTGQLAEGSDALLEGSETMYNEIKAIDLDAFDFDLDELFEHEEALKKIVKKQGSLSGHDESMAQSYKLMSRSPKLEKEIEEKEEQEVEETKKGFFARLKALFIRDK